MNCHNSNFSRTSEEIPTASLQTFFMDKNTRIAWQVRGKEFLHHGNLYDVVSMATNEKYIVITCFMDSRETRLFALFHKSGIKAKEGQSTYNHVKKVNQSKYLPAKIHTTTGDIVCLKTKPDRKKFPGSDCIIEIVPPPPKS